MGQYFEVLGVDNWVGVGPLSLSFPRLFRVVVNKRGPQLKIVVGDGGFVSQDVSVRRALHQFDESEFGSLLSLLSNIFIYKDVADSSIWKPCSFGTFSCKSFSIGGRVGSQNHFFVGLVGMGSHPDGCKSFSINIFCPT